MRDISKLLLFLAESLKLRVTYRVEQDVGGLVHHWQDGVVEKDKALGHDDGDLHSCHPREGAICTFRK